MTVAYNPANWWDKEEEPLKAPAAEKAPPIPINEPEPETELVTDLDFVFLGPTHTTATLRKFDTIAFEETYILITYAAGETIRVERRNLLYYSTRETKRIVSLKPARPTPATS